VRYADERYDDGGRYGEGSRPTGQRGFVNNVSGAPSSGVGRGGVGGGGSRVVVTTGSGSNGEGPQEGAVLMVYGLNMERMNADRLFNLLCLYGNVFKVKFLKTKEGSAMVQMGDAASVDRAIFYLNGLEFFNTKMNVK